MPGALEGLRILDLTRMLPGPYASMILADLGAEVVKIEDTGLGDPTRWSQRHRTDQSSTFVMLNRGKQSLALNLKSHSGTEVFRRLVLKADVVLEGFRPGVMKRLGIGYDSLKVIQPRLVFCSISGYGQEGPMHERGGHDVNYLALAGVLGLQTDSDRNPVLAGIQIADLGGALFAVIGILAALAARDRSGTGQAIDVSMTDVGLALLPIAASRLFAGEPVPLGTKLPLSGSLACYNIYATADHRHLSVGALEPKFWEAFCRVISREDLIPRQLEEGANQDSMISEIREIIKRRNLSGWLELFRETDACVEPVLSLEEAVKTPQARHRQMVLEPMQSRSRQLNLPFKFSGTPPEIRAPAPLLGEHTRDILAAHGYSRHEIEELIRSGAVAAS